MEAIELAIQCRIADREVVPAQGVRKAELARRLKLHMPQVDRLLNPKHSTKLDTLEQAFASLSKHLDLRIA